MLLSLVRLCVKRSFQVFVSLRILSGLQTSVWVVGGACVFFCGALRHSGYDCRISIVLVTCHKNLTVCIGEFVVSRSSCLELFFVLPTFSVSVFQ